MSARDTILAAIRAASPANDRRAIAAEAAALLTDPVRPALAAPILAESLEAKASALGTTFDHVSDMGAVPQAVRRYLDGHGLPPSLALQPAPALAALDWTGIDTHPALTPNEPVALGLALWGIAESGSLVVHSGPETPILLSFLPLHHIVVLHRDNLLAWLEDYADKLAAQAVPRNAILITGPSGTTDIEGSYVRGAHGPGFVHVIVVDGG